MFVKNITKQFSELPIQNVIFILQNNIKIIKVYPSHDDKQNKYEQQKYYYIKNNKK